MTATTESRHVCPTPERGCRYVHCPNVKGLRCPACRKVGRTTVLDSRPIYGAVTRRRKCSQCGARYRTHERIVDENFKQCEATDPGGGLRFREI